MHRISHHGSFFTFYKHLTKIKIHFRCVDQFYNVKIIHRYKFHFLKGKNACPLNPDNDRQITLLACFNKIFEILVLKSLKGWWDEEEIILTLQGRFKNGFSCLHSSLLLQESIAIDLDAKRNVFVAYSDSF